MESVVWSVPNCSGYDRRGKGHCGHPQQEPRQLVEQPFMCCWCGVTGIVKHGPYAPANNQPPRR